MVGAGEIVAQRLWGICPQKDAARVPHLWKIAIGVLREDFQVFGSDFICDVKSLGHIRDQYGA